MQQFKRVKVMILTSKPILEITREGHFHEGLIQFKNKLYLEGKSANIYIISDDKIKEGDWILFSYKRDEGMIFKFIEKDKFGSSKLYNPITKKEEWFGNMFVYKKIIATTDTSLNYIKHDDTVPYPKGEQIRLPQPSQQFIEKYIEEYNKGNIITDVLVEYEEFEQIYHDDLGNDSTLYQSSYNDYKLKINPKDNTITIKKVKDSWNKEEVIELIKRFNSESAGNVWFDTDEEWIKENL